MLCVCILYVCIMCSEYDIAGCLYDVCILLYDSPMSVYTEGVLARVYVGSLQEHVSQPLSSSPLSRVREMLGRTAFGRNTHTHACSGLLFLKDPLRFTCHPEASICLEMSRRCLPDVPRELSVLLRHLPSCTTGQVIT